MVEFNITVKCWAFLQQYSSIKMVKAVRSGGSAPEDEDEDKESGLLGLELASHLAKKKWRMPKGGLCKAAQVRLFQCAVGQLGEL